MKVNLQQKLLDPKGKEFTDGATIEQAAYNALSAPLPTDNQVTPEAALKRYRLIQTIARGGEQDLTAEDIAEIKKRAAVSLSIIAFGALTDALEQRASVVELAPEAKPAAPAAA